MTIINRGHAFVYLKSEKTAGTAVEAHLLTRTPLGGDIWHTAPNIHKYDLSRRRRSLVVGNLGGTLLTVREFGPLRRFGPFQSILEHHAAASLAPLLGAFWDRAIKATSVRNPWDIMVSAWQWRRDGKGNSPPLTASFEEWSTACLSGDAERQDRVHGYDAKDLMYPYVFIDGRPAVDVLIRQESIDEGLGELGERLGATLPPLTIRENRSCRRKDYRGYYTDKLADSVGRHFAEIISLCGYGFDP